ncbi:MAG: FlgD immunoglobulin-like domain containing protein [bacterium]
MFSHFEERQFWTMMAIGLALVMTAADVGGAQEWEVGDTTSFWAFDFHFFMRYYKTQMTLRAMGDHCYVWTEGSSWAQDYIDSADVAAVLEAFEERTWAADPTASGILADTSGIYDKVTSVFGPPPDIDGDPRIYILILDILDGGEMVGYFDPVNELYAWEDPHSNELDMIYIDCHPTDPSSDRGLASVAQQFTHLVHYNHDPDEECWIEEGLTQFAKFICGYGVTNYGCTKAPLTFLPDCKREISTSDKTKTAMFVQYLFEQYGIDLVRTLATDTDHTGTEAVTAALAANGYGDVSFDSVFFDEQLAWFMDSPQLWFFGGKYSFKYFETDAMFPCKMPTYWGTLNDSPYMFVGNQWSTDFIGVLPPAPVLGDTIFFYGDPNHEYELVAIKMHDPLAYFRRFDAAEVDTVEFLTLDSENRGCIDAWGLKTGEYGLIYIAVIHLPTRDGRPSRPRYILHDEFPIFPAPSNLRAREWALGKVALVWEPPWLADCENDGCSSGSSKDFEPTNIQTLKKMKYQREDHTWVAEKFIAATGFTGYNLYRSDFTGGPYEAIAGNIPTCSYEDTNVVAGQTYYYVVTALYENPSGESQYSNEVSGTPVVMKEVGNLAIAVSNYGSYGDPNFDATGRPSSMWPAGSGNNYLYDAGLWVGAIDHGEEFVTIYFYGPEKEWRPTGEPRPPRQLYTIGRGTLEVNVTYDDLEGPIDHIPLGLEVNQRARAWSMLEPDYDDFVLLEYWIKNLGTHGDLEGVFVSWWFDCDVASLAPSNPHIDDLVDFDGWDGWNSDTDELDIVENSVVGGTLPWVDANGNGVWDGYDEYGVPYGYNPGGVSNPNYDPSKIAPDGYPDEYTVWVRALGDTVLIPRNLSYMYDSDDPTTPEEDTGERNLSVPNTGYIGVRLICTPDTRYVDDLYELSPDTLGVVHSHQWWNWENDPQGSEKDQYNYMLGEHKFSMGYRYLPNPRDLGGPVFDYRFLLTAGPFDLSAGDSLRLVAGIVVGEGLKGLRANADNMLALCDSLGLCDVYETDINAPEPSSPIPQGFELAQNYPNPFNPVTSVQYSVISDQFPPHVTLKIYNILGQEVRTLVDEVKEAGYYTVIWDGRDSWGRQVSGGIYFYMLKAGRFIDTKRMLLLK